MKPLPRSTGKPVPELSRTAYAWHVARRVEDLPHDPLLVLIEDEEPSLSFDEWLALITTDEASDVDADAADSIRDLRDHGEH